jgi:magnesium transporter
MGVRSEQKPGGAARQRRLDPSSREGERQKAAAEGRVGRASGRRAPERATELHEPDPAIRGHLYDAGAEDREIAVTSQVISRLHDRRILWIDLPRRDSDELKRLGRLFGLDKRTVEDLRRPRDGLRLDNYGAYLQFAALAAPAATSADPPEARPTAPRDARVDFLVGRNWVVTVHSGDLAYFEAYRAQDKGDTETGALSAGALSASLLDWHLGEYFAEVSRIEAAIDEIDERILAAPSEQRLLEDILAIRRRSSRLRRALMAQRSVFYGLGRPDLGQGLDDGASAVLASLAARFERAVDEAEHTRDLSVGSFELFTSRSAQQTNDLVKALTFFTVIIGTTAAVAGLFGMNFDPPFFQTGSMGFFAVTAGLFVLGLAAWIVGRRRRWI